MPAPSVYTYSDTMLVAAGTLIRDAIDAGTGPGKLQMYSAADTELSIHTLSDPCGTVDAGGTLTITAPSDVNALVTLVCAWGRIVDSDNNVIVSLPVTVGTSPVAGYIVLSSVNFVIGAPVTVQSIVIG